MAASTLGEFDLIARYFTRAPRVDALLLDSGRPTLAVKRLGGTRRTHDRAVSREGRLDAGKVSDIMSAVRR